MHLLGASGQSHNEMSRQLLLPVPRRDARPTPFRWISQRALSGRGLENDRRRRQLALLLSDRTRHRPLLAEHAVFGLVGVVGSRFQVSLVEVALGEVGNPALWMGVLRLDDVRPCPDFDGVWFPVAGDGPATLFGGVRDLLLDRDAVPILGRLLGRRWPGRGTFDMHDDDLILCYGRRVHHGFLALACHSLRDRSFSLAHGGFQDWLDLFRRACGATEQRLERVRELPQLVARLLDERRRQRVGRGLRSRLRKDDGFPRCLGEDASPFDRLRVDLLRPVEVFDALIGKGSLLCLGESEVPSQRPENIVSIPGVLPRRRLFLTPRSIPEAKR